MSGQKFILSHDTLHPHVDSLHCVRERNSLRVADPRDMLKEIEWLQGKIALLQGAELTLEQLAQELIDEATRMGMVITIERKPLMPPAMGHAQYVIDIREARHPEKTS